ncbi:MAG: phosphoribosylaminoimidazolesuccinocarboxamide synthase [Planctomycetales bacterium 4484_113]|nr:MAG: phosphoribosylaminoimidazolesuccinocarboxamide synthase [Planctomycetales bacterium 4484_113]
MKWEKGELLYEGKAKRVFATQEPDYLIAEFKDSLTAFNGAMKAQLNHKGEWNNQISAHLMGVLEGCGIGTHFVELISPREQVVKRLEMIPVEFICRNAVAGSLAKRTGISEGTPLPTPVIEFNYKNDEMNDPLYVEDLIVALGIASREEIARIRTQGLKVNDCLGKFMDERGIQLVDFKLEFGRFHDELLVGDEVTPDTCRFWDKKDQSKLDKDRFRRKLGNVAEAYQQILDRVST